ALKVIAGTPPPHLVGVSVPQSPLAASASTPPTSDHSYSGARSPLDAPNWKRFPGVELLLSREGIAILCLAKHGGFGAREYREACVGFYEILLLSKLDTRRRDYVQHAHELVRFAQEYDDEQQTSKGLGSLVAAVHDDQGMQKETRTCHYCSKVGHLERDCRKKVSDKGGDSSGTRNFSLSVGQGTVEVNDWIVDSGASVHLVRDKTVLSNVVEVDEGMRSSRRIRFARYAPRQSYDAGQVVHTITFKDACFSPKLAINLISLGSLMERGCHLATVNGRHAIMQDTTLLWYVVIKNRVLVVDGQENESSQPSIAFSVQEMIATAVDELATSDRLKQHGSLHDFHRRFGHLVYDTIERLAADSTSGITLTDRS
ncbi:TPA: hypothetical protein N0F65_000591, partial [Lagenidium giganteum]